MSEGAEEGGRGRDERDEEGTDQGVGVEHEASQHVFSDDVGHHVGDAHVRRTHGLTVREEAQREDEEEVIERRLYGRQYLGPLQARGGIYMTAAGNVCECFYQTNRRTMTSSVPTLKLKLTKGSSMKVHKMAPKPGMVGTRGLSSTRTFPLNWMADSSSTRGAPL